MPIMRDCFNAKNIVPLHLKISKSIETTIIHADEVACGICNEYKENHQILEYAFKHAGRMIGTIHYEGVKK